MSSYEFEPYNFQGGVNAYSLREFFAWCAHQSVSDIHMQGGNEIVVSHHGRLKRATDFVLADDNLSKLVDEVFTPEIRATVKGGKPVDRALQIEGNEKGQYGLGRGDRIRYRCNFVQATAGRLDSTLALTMRVIPSGITPLKELGLEQALFEALFPASGMGLVGGITGSGKSTLLASAYRYCVETYPDRKITTLEDPIEFILGTAKDILPPTQLQIGRDVGSYGEGIRAALRRAPSIIGVGEMRDLETLDAGIQAAQVGHYNLTTVHINSPGEAIPRCLSLVPAERREASARALLEVLQFVVVQKLLRTRDGKRQAVREFMIIDDDLREVLASKPYMAWGRHIDGIIREEKRRIVDQAWELYLLGRLDRDELRSTMTSSQLREFEALQCA